MTTLAEAIAEVDAAIDRRESGEALAEEAERLSRDFRAFVYAAWPMLGYRPLVPTWHIDALCEHVQAAYERHLARLIVTIPPGYLKSSIFSVLGPAWRWTADPGERIISASHMDELATRDTRRSRQLMQTAWFQSRWRERFSFAEDENLKTRYSNNQGGHRVRTHVGGGTGDRGSVLLLDDPHNAQEAHSEVMLQSAKDWWGETWASRLDDSVEARGVKMVIGQRIHEKDLIGHLLVNDEDAGRWTHLCLPVRYEKRHPFVYPEKVKLRNGRVIHGDKRKREGELLAPDFMDDELLADRTAEMTAHTFAGQYQQRPAPQEGLLLKREHWRYYPPDWSYYAPRGRFDSAAKLQLPKFTMIVDSWDTSVKDRAHSDFVSGQSWGVNGANRWLLRLYHRRAGLNATIEAMLDMYHWVEENFDCAHYVLIEESANGPDAIAEIKARIQGVIPWPAKGSKQMRAEAAQPALDGRNCYLPGYVNEEGTNYDARTPAEVQDFIEELAIFDQGANDDQVDAWSQMVNWTRKHGKRVGRVSKPSGLKPRPAALPG